MVGEGDFQLPAREPFLVDCRNEAPIHQEDRA